MTTLGVDILSVRKIYARGDNNTILPGNTFLTTDGIGGTIWTSLSSINAGLAFNTFTTTASTFTSSPGNTRFSILDGSNIGLLPTTGAAGTLYSKSFGQVNVSGQSSINSFNSITGQFNNTINITASGVIRASTNTVTNELILYSPNDAFSSLSSLISNMSSVNYTINNAINSFQSPFSTFIYNELSSFSTGLGSVINAVQLNTALSSFSTALGPVIQGIQLNSALSSFSTSLGPTITSLTFASSLSTNITSSLFTTQLNTSSISILGNRQPFIQFGSGTLSSTSTLITLVNPYVNSNYVIQLTYRTGTNTFFVPLSFSSVTASNFIARGDSNATVFHWTTYGNLF